MRFRSPLLSQSRFLYFPSGTEMVHFPEFARARLWIHRAVRGFYPRGFPHSEIPGSMPTCGSPRLIAACHVLLRLLLPRHPPCALSSLTIKLTRHMLVFNFVRIFQFLKNFHSLKDLSFRAKRGICLSCVQQKPSTHARRFNPMGHLVICSSRAHALRASHAPAVDNLRHS